MIQSLTAKIAVATFGLTGLFTCLAASGWPATPANAHAHLTTPFQGASQRVLKIGKYQVELRIPDEGLFASEEVDVEFRVSDTTEKDPVEDGFRGVANVEATGLVTMPSMAGMPPAKPEIHREGVPGEYGVVLYFPHGGGYQLDLNLAPPNAKPFTVTFQVDVKDERPANLHKSQPFSLKVLSFPNVAGKEAPLVLRVIDNKTGKTQSAFDEAHTKKFHLLIASKDLNWFVHEHPAMASDGTWSIPLTLPAGGEYGVYGDVAPSGKGSRILIANIKVTGIKPTWDTKLRLTNKASDGGLKGVLSSVDGPIPIGRMTTMRIKLFDVKTGKPAGDTVKWLGASGHLMIFHSDRQTVVHSHPQEDAKNEELVKRGVVQFNARFPKPGIYKAYGQFDWQGKVRTLGFTVEVK